MTKMPQAAHHDYGQLLRADKLTTDELDYLIGHEGRNAGPSLLADAYSEDKITAETVTALIGGIWSGAEYPDRHLDRDTWRWLFDVAGFTIDGEPAERPTEPILLWRGTVPERRTDWSWTTDRTIAEGYANGTAARRPTGRLHVVLAPPEALLAANNGRSEAEYVVDTRGLTITEAQW
ncbi:hypothetical protein ACIRRI_06925 [Streptomyces mirabilis]|uniref:hypothetical protein n=1 Tax=Streptomyces mirabilis TaxID=68239 RepID=UPI0038194F55